MIICSSSLYGCIIVNCITIITIIIIIIILLIIVLDYEVKLYTQTVNTYINACLHVPKYNSFDKALK